MGGVVRWGWSGREEAVNGVEQKPTVRWGGGIVGEVVRWGGTIFKLSKIEIYFTRLIVTNSINLRPSCKGFMFLDNVGIAKICFTNKS